MENLYIGTAPTKVRTDVLYDEGDVFRTNEIDYESTLEDEVALNEIMVNGTSYRRTNKGVNEDNLKYER